MLAVWDSMTGNPIKTIFNPHKDGVECLDMSPDAMFIVTLSRQPNQAKKQQSEATSMEQDIAQEIKLWEWTVAREGPLYMSGM